MKKTITITSLLFIGVVLIGVIFILKEKKSDLPEAVACTMEALMCPDGSAVGRSGPECAFAPCTHMESLMGTLEQTEGGFRLIMQVPESGMGATYALSLLVPESVELSNVVGKRVVVRGEFTQGNTLQVSTLTAVSGDLSDQTLGDVKVGEKVFINGVTIALNEVVQDSRCPSDVTCIRAGDVTANVTLESDTDLETRNITSDTDPSLFDAYQISIKDVSPYPVSSANIEQSEYIIRFEVVQN